MSHDPNGVPAGYYYEAGATAYLVDPAGTYCVESASDPAGVPSGQRASMPTLAAAGTYVPVAAAASSAAKIVDPAGTYSGPSASAATIDPAGASNDPGASAPTPAADTYELLWRNKQPSDPGQ